MRPLVSTAVAILIGSALLVAQQPDTAASAAAIQARPASTAPALSDADIEQFLLHARVIKTKGIKKGVTGSSQATLTDGKLTHDAHMQTIDQRLQQFAGSNGGVEFDFRDSWTFNLAAFKIDRLIGLNMVPVSVARRYNYTEGAFTWWLDDVMMDEQARLKLQSAAKSKPELKFRGDPPDTEIWNQQMQMVRLFDQLIANIDRNLGNLIITKDWRLWPIDHTRAFRTYRDLKTPANVTRVERKVLERMKALDRDALKRETGKYLTTFQIDAVLARRDAIVARIEGLGPAALFDRTGW